MLSDEGQYDELCGPDGCAAQADKFAAIFATATLLVNGISLPSGLYLDHCGGRVMSGARSNKQQKIPSTHFCSPLGDAVSLVFGF
jgi:hypothetical protein